MKTFIGILVGMIVGITVAWHIPIRKTITTEVTLVKEISDCRKKGGEFWIHPNYGAENFPAYNMRCEKNSSEILSEFNF